ncbi:unnamed protein product [Didymodactylos carnosus]|nr:unnamed protein product [Didymodactylos carnosus]CAF4461642.1 unnamed protein product [Didymodactylos carnosus]
MSITIFETLPNEILIEIFDYIKQHEIMYLFFNQNRRFNYLLSNYYANDIDLRYTSYKIFNYYCCSIIPLIASTIRSLKLGYEHCSTEQLYLFSKHLVAFDNLKYLHLYCRQEQDLELYLKFVKNLYCLTITIDDHISLSNQMTRCLFNKINFLLEECSIRNGVFSLKNHQYLSICFLQILTIELEFYSHLLILFDFIPHIKRLNIKLKWFDFNVYSIINYDYKTIHMKIRHLSNLKLHFNQVLLSNGYNLIVLLIRHIVSLQHLSLSISYLSNYSVINGQCMEIDLLSPLSNLIEFNFYFRFSYNNQQNNSIISSFRNDYWLLKRKQKIISYTDRYENDFYLYSLSFVFDDIDCISNGIFNYKANDDDDYDDDCIFQSYSTISSATPYAYDLFWSLHDDILRMFKNIKCLKFYLNSCRLANKASSLVLANVNTIICHYLQPNQQLFEEHFSHMLPNVYILKIDDVSIRHVVDEQSFLDIRNTYFFKHITELHMNGLIIDDSNEKTDYILVFLRYFSNIKIIKLQFVIKMHIQLIQSILDLLISNKRCLLSFIQFYSLHNN